MAITVAVSVGPPTMPMWSTSSGSLLPAALAVFIGVGDPHDSPAPDTDPIAITIGVAAIVGAVLGLVAIARTRSLVGESVLLATGAGLLYGLQDAATRAAFVRIDHH